MVAPEEFNLEDAPNEDILNRIVELKDDLENSGANVVIKQVEALTKILKENMIRNRQNKVVDEVSGSYAEIEVRTETIYDVNKLAAELGLKSDRYITNQVDKDAIKLGLESGDISQTTLDKVITKVPKNAAIYIKKLRGINA